MTVAPTTVNEFFGMVQASGTQVTGVNHGLLNIRSDGISPALTDLDLNNPGASIGTGTKRNANAAITIHWALHSRNTLLTQNGTVGGGVWLFPNNTDGAGAGTGGFYLDLFADQSVSFPSGGSLVTQLSGSVSIPAAQLQDAGSYRIVPVLHSISVVDGDPPTTAKVTNNTNEFYIDADNNVASATGISATPAFTARTTGRDGWFRIGAIAQSLTFTRTAGGGSSVANKLRYPNTYTQSGDIHSFGLKSPLAVQVGIVTSGSSSTATYSKSQTSTPASGTGVYGPTATQNVDTLFPSTPTNYRFRARINSGDRPAVLTANTLSGGFSADQRWCFFATPAAGIAKVSGDDFSIENTTDQEVMVALDYFAETGLTTQGAGIFQSAAYTTPREIFRRRGPTITQQATPHMEVYVTDGDGTKLSAVSIRFEVRDSNGAAVTENDQTLATESAGTAGRRRWNYTVLATHRAFNRFKKGAGDNPRSPPTKRFSAVVTNLNGGTIIGAGNFLVNDATNFNLGDVIVIDQGGAQEEQVVVSDLDYLLNRVVLVGTLAKTHAANATVRKPIPLYPKSLRITGAAFGSNNPQDTTADEFGVNSELHCENIWAGDVADATIDAEGTPTGKAKTNKQSGAGSVQFKITTSIERDTGSIRDLSEHNVRTVDGANVVATTDELDQRKAIWDATKSLVELSPTNSNIRLNTTEAYSTSPNSGFESHDVVGDGRLVDIVLAFADTAGQRSTFDLTGSPGAGAHWNKGQVPNTNIGFTGDTGNYGLFSTRMAFFVLDAFLFVQTVRSQNVLPTGAVPHFSVQVNRKAPDGALTPTKADGPLSVYIAKDGGPGIGLDDVVVNDQTTAINPDVEGKSSSHEYTPISPLALTNGTYSIEFHATVGGSPVISRGSSNYTIGTDDVSIDLTSFVGKFDLIGRLWRPGDEFNVTLLGLRNEQGVLTNIPLANVPVATGIIGVDQVNDAFTIAGDQTANFGAGRFITVSGSTGNDGTYRVWHSHLDGGGDTEVHVTTAIPNATADGDITYNDKAAFTIFLRIGSLGTETLLPDLETWATTAAFNISAVDQGAKKFTIAGLDLTSHFVTRAPLQVAGSTGNNGLYTVDTSAFVGGNTEITVDEAIPDATADGTIAIQTVATEIPPGFVIPGSKTGNWKPPLLMFLFHTAVFDDNGAFSNAAGSQLFNVVESRNIRIPVLAGSLHASGGSWKAGHGYAVSSDIISLEDNVRLDADVETSGPDIGLPKAWVSLFRSGDATTGTQYLHSDNTWHNVKDIGTGGEPTEITRTRLQQGGTSKRYFFVFHDTAPFNTGFDTSTWDDIADLSALLSFELNGVLVSETATEEVGLEGIKVSVSSGDIAHPESHPTPGDPITFNAIVEDVVGKLTIDGPNSLIPSVLDPDAEISLRRFRSATGDLEEWSGSAWVEVADGASALTYLPMVRGSVDTAGGDPALAIYQLPGTATAGEANDIIYNVRLRHRGIRYSASGSTLVVGGKNRHDRNAFDATGLFK